MEGIKTANGILWNGHVAQALCLDLDGTVRFSESDKQFIDGPDDVAVYPDVVDKIFDYRKNDWMIIGISNQGGVAHGFKTVAQVEAELDATLKLVPLFHMVKQCYHDATGSVFPYSKRSLMRKPAYGMLVEVETEMFAHGYVIDWDKSLFVGDRAEDEACAVAAGIPFQSAAEFFGRLRDGDQK